MIGNVIGVLFDGIAYGSLLFIIAVGPVGDDRADELRQPRARRVRDGRRLRLRRADDAARRAVPRDAAASPSSLPRVVGVVLERTLYQRLYKASHLDQVLFSIGLVFMSIAVATYFFGPSQQPVALPAYLRGQVHVLGLDFGVYRIFLIVVVAALTRRAAATCIERTRFGSQVRASVDNATAAAGLGINVNRVFALTFALGSGLAGLGGGLGIDVLGLDPTFPLKYMVYFLLVVAVGGAGTIKGPLDRRADPRRVRRRGQSTTCREVGALRHLCADGRAADPVPGRAVRTARADRAMATPATIAVPHSADGRAALAGRPLARARDRVLADAGRLRSSCFRTTACSAARS